MKEEKEPKSLASGEFTPWLNMQLQKTTAVRKLRKLLGAKKENVTVGEGCCAFLPLQVQRMRSEGVFAKQELLI